MRIFYSNPYNVNKNIGGAINEFCEIVPRLDDWIVLQDGDIIYLTPDWGKLIHQSLLVNGHEFGIVGCYTNRLRGLHQLYGNQLSNDHNLKNHYKIAVEYSHREPKVNELQNLGIAGMFMAFQKKTWLELGKFQNNSITFDSDFYFKARDKGYKTGLINNLYVYHSYRLWNDENPADDTQHLYLEN